MDRWLAERRAENRQRAAVLERAEQLGIKATPRGGWGNTTTVCLTTNELAAICDRIEKRTA
jgi:hypothetical protein